METKRELIGDTYCDVDERGIVRSDEIERLRTALKSIAKLAAINPQGNYDAIALAHCFGKAQEIARAALAPC